MDPRACALAILLSTLFAPGDAGGSFDLKLVRYSNSRGYTRTHRYCDRAPFGGRTTRCDLVFSVSLSLGSWRFPTVHSKVYHDQDSVNFGSYLSNNEDNPIRRRFSRWLGTLSVALTVTDRDFLSGHDPVDAFHVLMRAPPDGVYHRAVVRGHIHRQYSVLVLSLRVVCDRGFHPPSCSKFCRPRNDARGHYTCDRWGNKRCLPGWLHARRDCRQRDPCAGLSCLHGGRCEAGGGAAACRCPPGRVGRRCERPHPCPRPCLHGGRCGPQGCVCLPGWAGDRCQRDENECLGSGRCLHGGNCTNSPGSFRCSCPGGFSGRRCETRVSPCEANATLCANGGRCQAARRGFVCQCPAGFAGRRCEQDTRGCRCLHGGTCGADGCLCPPGWAGPRCGHDVDECRAIGVAACGGGGVCENLPGTFRCRCRENFSGARCERCRGPACPGPARLIAGTPRVAAARDGRQPPATTGTTAAAVAATLLLLLLLVVAAVVLLLRRRQLPLLLSRLRSASLASTTTGADDPRSNPEYCGLPPGSTPSELRHENPVYAIPGPSRTQQQRQTGAADGFAGVGDGGFFNDYSLDPARSASLGGDAYASLSYQVSCASIQAPPTDPAAVEELEEEDEGDSLYSSITGRTPMQSHGVEDDQPPPLPPRPGPLPQAPMDSVV